MVPVELSLNSKRRKVKTTDFFVNANDSIEFFLKNSLKNETTLELQRFATLVKYFGKN
ncbi:MAG: hypothetical protein NY202_01025 [Mollicutes bacterium UO1]